MDKLEAKMSSNSSKYAWHLIGKASHLLFWVRQSELTPYNILPRQAYILSLLYNLDHKATLDELSRLTDRKTGTLSIIISRMERDGLVTKLRENPRSVLLKYELTKKGIDAYKISSKLKSEKAIFSVLSEEERQQLISILEKVITRSEKIKKAKQS